MGGCLSVDNNEIENLSTYNSSNALITKNSSDYGSNDSKGEIESSSDNSSDSKNETESSSDSDSFNAPINKTEIKKFMKDSAKKKEKAKSVPTLNELKKTYAEASNFTKQVLNEKPSGNASDKSTLLHVINQLSTSSGKKVLFSDSVNNVGYDNSVVDNDAAKTFSLTLKSIESCYECENKSEMYKETEILAKLKRCLDQKEDNQTLNDIQNKLAKAHGINPKRIVIRDIYFGSTNIDYFVTDLTDNEKNSIINKSNDLQSKLAELFDDFETYKVHPALLFETYDINMFDPLGDKKFSSGETFKVGPPGKTREYIQPVGWSRYGLKVLGKYNNDKWLHPFQDPGNWYRAYHGTDRNAGALIYKSKFRPGSNNQYGVGIYCGPEVDIALDYCRSRNGIVTLNTKTGTKKFAFVLQVAVNPDKMNNPNFIPNFNSTCEDVNYWIAPTGDDIRPYGILIKEVNN